MTLAPRPREPTRIAEPEGVVGNEARRRSRRAHLPRSGVRERTGAGSELREPAVISAFPPRRRTQAATARTTKPKRETNEYTARQRHRNECARPWRRHKRQMETARRRAAEHLSRRMKNANCSRGKTQAGTHSRNSTVETSAPRTTQAATGRGAKGRENLRCARGTICSRGPGAAHGGGIRTRREETTMAAESPQEGAPEGLRGKRPGAGRTSTANGAHPGMNAGVAEW